MSSRRRGAALIAIATLAMGLACIIIAVLPAMRSKRAQVFVEDD